MKRVKRRKLIALLLEEQRRRQEVETQLEQAVEGLAEGVVHQHKLELDRTRLERTVCSRTDRLNESEKLRCVFERAAAALEQDVETLKASLDELLIWASQSFGTCPDCKDGWNDHDSGCIFGHAIELIKWKRRRVLA